MSGPDTDQRRRHVQDTRTVAGRRWWGERSGLSHKLAPSFRRWPIGHHLNFAGGEKALHRGGESGFGNSGRPAEHRRRIVVRVDAVADSAPLLFGLVERNQKPVVILLVLCR